MKPQLLEERQDLRDTDLLIFRIRRIVPLSRETPCATSPDDALGTASGRSSRKRESRSFAVAEDDRWDSTRCCAVPKEVVRARWEASSNHRGAIGSIRKIRKIRI